MKKIILILAIAAICAGCGVDDSSDESESCQSTDTDCRAFCRDDQKTYEQCEDECGYYEGCIAVCMGPFWDCYDECSDDFNDCEG